MNASVMQVQWLHGDMLGSASLLTDSGGNTVGQARYKPFGERRSEWNAYFTDRKFTGYAREDALGGIDFAQARFYDPLIGRFLSPDTIYDGGLADPQGLNRYSYVKGHVMSATDPTGHGCGPTSTPTPGTSACDGSGGISGSGGYGGDTEVRSSSTAPTEPIGPSRQLPAAGESSAPYNTGKSLYQPAGSVHWGQDRVSETFSNKLGPFQNRLLTDVAEDIHGGAIQADTLKLKVFEKTPEMDSWPMNTEPTKGYTGDWRNLKNGEIYALNNRSLTVQTLAETNPLRVEWATKTEIIDLAYQNSTPNLGTSVLIKESNTTVSLVRYR